MDGGEVRGAAGTVFVLGELGRDFTAGVGDAQADEFLHDFGMVVGDVGAQHLVVGQAVQQRGFAPDGGVAPPVVGNDGHQRSPADADVGAMGRQVVAERAADVLAFRRRLDASRCEHGGRDVGVGDEALVGLPGPRAVGVAHKQHQVGHGAGERVALLADQVLVVRIAQVMAVVGRHDDHGVVRSSG